VKPVISIGTELTPAVSGGTRGEHSGVREGNNAKFTVTAGKYPGSVFTAETQNVRLALIYTKTCYSGDVWLLPFSATIRNFIPAN
jgi:hypothetical protein